MGDNDLREVLQRLDEMGARLDGVVQRLERLETTGATSPRVEGPPPVLPLAPPTPSPQYTTQPARPSREAAALQGFFLGASDPINPLRPVLTPPPAQVKFSQSDEDLEYKIGSIWLTRGGAGAMIIGLIYLVTWVVANHKASPLSQFIGEQLLCFALVAAGLWKRNEREDFGQLLSGVGSCGLYLSFAGAYAFKHLYASSTLVELFMALSLLNLCFAFWRASKSFLVIGMLGGLIAAMLPMHDYNAPLDVELQFLILAPTALIVIRNRWAEMALILWGASTLALLPIYTYNGHLWELRVGALYADALVCAGAYAICWKPKELDPYCWCSAAMIAIAGVGGLAIEGVKHGSSQVIILALGAGLLGSRMPAGSRSRHALVGAGFATALTLVPMGGDRVQAALIFGVLSILASIASVVGQTPKTTAAYGFGNALLAFGLLEFILGLGAYLGFGTINEPQATQGFLPLPPRPELWILATFTVAIVVGCICWYRRGGEKETCASVGFVVFTSLFERFGYVSLSTSSSHIPIIVAVFATTSVLTAAALVFAHQTRLKSALAAVWVSFGILLCIYSGLLGDTDYTVSRELGVIGVMVALGLLASWLTATRFEAERQYIIGVAGLGVGSAIMRCSLITLPHEFGFAPDAASFAAGTAVWFAVACLIGYQTNWPSMLANCWIAFGVLAVSALMPVSGGPDYLAFARQFPPEFAFEVVALAAAFVLAHLTLKITGEDKREAISVETPLAFVGAIVGLLLLRLGYHELPLRAGFTPMAGMTTGALLTCCGALVATRRSRWLATLVLSWAALLVGLGAILPMAWMEVGERGNRHEIELLLLAVITTLFVARETALKTKERVTLTSVVVFLEWLGFWRLIWALLRPLRLDDSAVATIAWTAFAAVLIAIGFRYKAPLVRYSALAFFALVIGKAFLYDMASLDTGFKIAIFLFLGACMIGGGYAYIRLRTPKPQTP